MHQQFVKPLPAMSLWHMGRWVGTPKG